MLQWARLECLPQEYAVAQITEHRTQRLGSPILHSDLQWGILRTSETKWRRKKKNKKKKPKIEQEVSRTVSAMCFPQLSLLCSRCCCEFFCFRSSDLNITQCGRADAWYCSCLHFCRSRGRADATPALRKRKWSYEIQKLAFRRQVGNNAKQSHSTHEISALKRVPNWKILLTKTEEFVYLYHQPRDAKGCEKKR